MGVSSDDVGRLHWQCWKSSGTHFQTTQDTDAPPELDDCSTHHQKA
jgi:hypothetical protein